MKRARGFDAILKWLAWGMFLGSLAAAISACGWLGGKAPAQYAEELMEDDIELESRGDDAMALVDECRTCSSAGRQAGAWGGSWQGRKGTAWEESAMEVYTCFINRRMERKPFIGGYGY